MKVRGLQNGVHGSFMGRFYRACRVTAGRRFVFRTINMPSGCPACGNPCYFCSNRNWGCQGQTYCWLKRWTRQKYIRRKTGSTLNNQMSFDFSFLSLFLLIFFENFKFLLNSLAFVFTGQKSCLTISENKKLLCFSKDTARPIVCLFSPQGPHFRKNHITLFAVSQKTFLLDVSQIIRWRARVFDYLWYLG